MFSRKQTKKNKTTGKQNGKARRRTRAIGFESLESRRLLSGGGYGGGFGFGLGFGFGGGFGGSSHTSGSTSTPTVATSITPVSASNTTPTYGQSVALSATVTATSGTPSGLVQFTDGTMVIGTAQLKGGVATLNIGDLSAGTTHSITAQYLGNGTYIASSISTAASVTVSQATTITAITAAHNPVATGDAATFLIQVSPSGGSSSGMAGGCGLGGGLQGAAPSGTVTISALEPGQTTPTVLSTDVQLYNGRAIFSTTALPAGTSAITATYNGDANYTGSASQSVSQLIGATLASSSLSAIPSSRPVVVNTATSLTVNLTAGRSSTVGTAPTGTITVYDATTGTTITTTASVAAVGSSTTKATASVPVTFATAGVNLLVITYSGDGNYASQQITIAVNVQSTSSSSRGRL